VKSILAVSVTGRGRALAARLPYERVHGNLASTVRERWTDVDGFVLVAAAGACVRIVAPLLSGKNVDPAVVCLDDAGRYAIALIGGHSAQANDLARQVAGLLGAEPVITTATDVTGTVPIDELSGLAAEGDVAAITAALLDGRPVSVANPLGWPLPAALQLRLDALPTPAGEDAPRLIVTDEIDPSSPATVFLRPPTLVAGIGASTAPPPGEVAALLDEALGAAGVSRLSLRAIATIDRRAREPALAALGLPVIAYSADELATVTVPNPSGVVEAAVGTPSVAEAAALLAAGPGATLLLEKRAAPHTTVALARSSRPRGHVAVVGLGPGHGAMRTPQADVAIRAAEVVIGYGPYVEQCRDLLGPSQDVIGSPIGAEIDRAREAVHRASEGARVAVVCSGDPGIYAMASLVLEEAGGEPGFEIDIVPGVTAALAASASLGAPLGHDHIVISLSDLLTPWEAIVRRVIAARDADLVLAIYNPRSKARDWQLDAVRDLLLEGRPPDTPVGIATDVGRPDATTTVTTLAALDAELVGMTTCVIIGSSTTRVVGGRMVTPRGYRRERNLATSPAADL
jgi:cobalt-precorrin 5A hydrolase / cobalt-factor III methyltransferase / precorrin-3B C17-methyltransferase